MYTASLRGVGADPGYTASGQPYSSTTVSALPTGPGWNQGVQPVPTLGEGGTAVPVAAGDFTIPYTGVVGGAPRPGIFVNALGYSSQASLDASNAAVKLLDIAKTYGYISTGEPALTQYASGALVPYLQYVTEQYAPNTLSNVAPTPVSVTPMPPTTVLNPPSPNQTPVTTQQIANGTTGGTFDMSGATTWLQSNWMLIAAGVAAVVILPSLLGGKR